MKGEFIMAMTIVSKQGKVFKSKKELKEHIKDGKSILLSDPSMFNPIEGGNFFDPTNREFSSYTFVLPTQYSRKSFGNVIWKNGKLTVK